MLNPTFITVAAVMIVVLVWDIGIVGKSTKRMNYMIHGCWITEHISPGWSQDNKY
jgi:hypothetical protein